MERINSRREVTKRISGSLEDLDQLVALSADWDEPHKERVRNVAFKLSGLLTRIYISGATVADLKPYVRALADVVGPERVAFGSDWPVCTAVSDYAGTVGIAQRLAESFGPDAQEQIFRRSAMAAYRLGWQ
jgi:predicted TIM-barrel fold metal-dependent hydrolase